MHEFSQAAQFSAVGTTGTSADLVGDIIDMASGGFTRVLGIAHGAASQADAQLTLQTGTASDDMSDATGNVMGDKANLYLDVNNPRERFARFRFEAGSATIAYKSLVTIAYGARSEPVTQHASTTGLYLNQPGSGTASG